MWDLPRPGLESMSPALAGGFLTTAPPGKPFPGRLLYCVAILYVSLSMSHVTQELPKYLFVFLPHHLPKLMFCSCLCTRLSESNRPSTVLYNLVLEPGKPYHWIQELRPPRVEQQWAGGPTAPGGSDLLARCGPQEAMFKKVPEDSSVQSAGLEGGD